MTWVTAESPKGLEGIKGATGEESTDYYGGNMVAESVTPANARLIARAVNAHDDLLAAGKAILADIDALPTGDREFAFGNPAINIEGLRAAIVKAESIDG